MFWNGRRNDLVLGSCDCIARFGKNGVIQICGRCALTRRTPKSRVLDTVIQYIGSLFAPIVCANGAQRPHEFVRPMPEFAASSCTAGALPSAFTTHSVALLLLYELPLGARLNSTHWPSGENDG